LSLGFDLLLMALHLLALPLGELCLLFEKMRLLTEAASAVDCCHRVHTRLSALRVLRGFVDVQDKRPALFIRKVFVPNCYFASERTQLLW
jgi:hypothetical protein